jgi:hypothetical protein
MTRALATALLNLASAVVAWGIGLLRLESKE